MSLLSKSTHTKKSLETYLMILVTLSCLMYHFLFFLWLFNSFRIFPTSVNWWFLTGDWVTEGTLKSPGLFSVFYPILMILLMVSSRHLTSKSVIACTSLLVSVPRVSWTIGTTLTFMFHSFFSPQARSTYLYFF